ncbi:C4-dicarboxylate ABC transporter substrate-binding protein [Clostridiales bacterium PH28_bin88]|nr:C4-dicarboxylate ABC transporter substrate-binding protein [Clostridiales bacterium PH28_bin88]
MVAVGCGQGGQGSGKAAPPKQVTVVTGSTGGTYYPVGTFFATLWNEKLKDTGINASAQSSGGSVENLNMLKAGEAELGIAMTNVTYFAYQGQERFKDNPVPKVRFVTGLWPDVTQFVVTQSSGINSVADIRGKRFSVGAAGSGTEYSTRMILKLVGGFTFDDIQKEHLGYFESSGAMQNGQLDGMNAEGGVPTSAVAEIFASRTPVKLLEFSDEDYEKLRKEVPFYLQHVIPAGTYSNQDKEVKTLGVKSALVSSADVDEELIYNLVKTIYENMDSVKTAHKALEYLTLERAVEGLPPVPLHAGAVRYFKEKGLQIPNELIPPEYK